MPLSFSCPACEKELSAPFAAAGLTGACKFCGARITAPYAAGQPATLVSEPTPAGAAASAGPGAAPPPPPPPPFPPMDEPPSRTQDVMSNPKVAKAFMYGRSPGISDFWKRTLAFGLDMVVISGIQIALAMMLLGRGIRYTDALSAPRAYFGQAMNFALALFAAKVLYGAIFEGSPLQATPGKFVLGMRVCLSNGAPVTPLNALWRNLCKWIIVTLVGFVPIIGIFPYLIFYYATQDDKTQTLHDMMADTVVAERY